MPGPPESHPAPRGGPPRFDLVRSSVGPRGWLFVVWMPVASLLAIGLGGGFVVLLNSMALVERSWLGWVALLVVPLLWFVLVRAYSQVLLPPAVLVIEPDAVRVLTAKGGEVVGLQRPSLVVRCARSSRHGKWWTNYYAALVQRARPGGTVVNVEVSCDLDAPELPAMLEAWAQLQRRMGTPAESLVDLPARMRSMLAILPHAAVEALLREAGIAMPVRFLQSFLITGWFGARGV